MKPRKAGTKTSFEKAEEKHDISNLKSRKIASLKKTKWEKEKNYKKIKINYKLPYTPNR